MDDSRGAGESVGPVPVEGSVNLRDMGGYRTEQGRQVDAGKLFRSGTLAYLTDRGIDHIGDLRVRLICDLRRPVEREEEPTPAAVDAHAERLEIPIDPGSAVALRERMTTESFGLQARIDFMTAVTSELITDHAADYAQMFTGLLEMEEGGFLVHCSAGKDRTGVGCALILHALGVPEQTVMRDYLLTNELLDYEGFVLPRLVSRWEPQQLPDKESVLALAGVREEYLRAAYDALHAEFESVEHYIRDAIGLGDTELAELRARYLS